MHVKTKLLEHAAGRQSPVAISVIGRGQFSDAGRKVKPGTYFDAGPELTMEEHRCIGTAILQDSAHQHTQPVTLLGHFKLSD